MPTISWRGLSDILSLSMTCKRYRNSKKKRKKEKKRKKSGPPAWIPNTTDIWETWCQTTIESKAGQFSAAFQLRQKPVCRIKTLSGYKICAVGYSIWHLPKSVGWGVKELNVLFESKCQWFSQTWGSRNSHMGLGMTHRNTNAPTQTIMEARSDKLSPRTRNPRI